MESTGDFKCFHGPNDGLTGSHEKYWGSQNSECEGKGKKSFKNTTLSFKCPIRGGKLPPGISRLKRQSERS